MNPYLNLWAVEAEPRLWRFRVRFLAKSVISNARVVKRGRAPKWVIVSVCEFREGARNLVASWKATPKKGPFR